MKFKGSLLIVLLLTVLLLPMTAGAETKTGTCGDNLTYTLTDDGVLTITGTGHMWGYSYNYNNEPYTTTAPWGSAPVQVVIEKGVTSIGKYAFSYCISLSSVTIPDSVTSIGDDAFCGCTSLSSITIPDSVTSIGNYAFSGSTSLSSVTIPDSVTSIGGGAFSGCTSLSSVTIPEGVTSIGNYAFYKCTSLASIQVKSGNTTYASEDGVLFNIDRTTLITCPGGKTGTYIVPPGVASIGDDAFSGCTSLSSVTIPKGVTSIGDEAFLNCINLTSVTIPEGVTNIGYNAFSGCTSITKMVIPEGVNNISGAFYGCTSLTNVTIPESVTNIDGAFFGCSSLSCITIPTRVTNIRGDTFAGCASLSSISIPDGVTNIDRLAFIDCSSLASITIPASVTSIGESAFLRCTNLTKVLIYGETTTFGKNVFSNPYPTVYCYEYSDADAWATAQGYEVVYLDGGNMEDLFTLTLQDDFRLICGESRAIGINIFPDGEHPAVTWVSSAPEIVSVEDGVATAIAPGTATITATMGNLSDSVEITAYAAAKDFELSAAECWVIAKESVQLAVTKVTPTNAEVTFTWTSTDDTVATVSADGLVTTKKPGDVVISVDSDNGLRRECLVHACYPVTEIAFANEPAALEPGDTLQLTANVTMRTQSCVNQLVAFSSSDETVATVSASGLVTALKSGTAKITAAAKSGVSATIEIQLKGMEPEILRGDVTNDGNVDGRDLLRLARFIAGDTVAIDEKAADMNGDGNVDGRDVLRLAKRLAGM